ncbi:MAG TPA: CsgG/HfaB family protein [Gemmatimonadales bacterium]|nr:CsgG/HfaB family protein [Gemmatimonadales bacterium]
MRRTLSILLLATALPVAGAAAQEARPSVAVLPFENGGSYGQDREVFDALELGLQALLISELTGNPGLDVLARSRVTAAPRPQTEGSSAIDAATAASTGKALGARYVVLGAFIDHYGRFRLDARVIDTESGRIVDVVSNDPALRDRRELYAMLQSLARRIAGTLEAPAPKAPERAIPTDALNAYSRGLLHLQRGERTEAAAAFERALQSAPAFTEAREALQQSRSS